MGLWDDIKSVGQTIINPLPKVSKAVFGDDPNNFANQLSSGLSKGDVAYNYASGNKDPWGTAAKNAYGFLPVSGLTSPNDSQWNFGLKPTPDPAAPPQDPRIAEIKQGQNDLYNQFSANKGNTEKNLLRQYQLQAHRDLADQQSQIRRDAASKGLMYSGIRAGREAGAASSSARNVADAKYNINNATDAFQQQLQAEAQDAGFMQQRLAADFNDTIYNAALKNMASRNSAMANIGQAGGAAAGAYAGSKRS